MADPYLLTRLQGLIIGWNKLIDEGDNILGTESDAVRIAHYNGCQMTFRSCRDVLVDLLAESMAAVIMTAEQCTADGIYFNRPIRSKNYAFLYIQTAFK
jgi:hypothetical protein